jgi:hypothetical protein
VVAFDLSAYGETVASLLDPHERGQRLAPLAPSCPLECVELRRLRESGAAELFAGAGIIDSRFAECVRSALFLYFSALEDSHVISQGIDTPTGSFLHGVMHRQEPDFGNAKYWFRRAGDHEVSATLRDAALNHLRTAAAESAAIQHLYRQIEERVAWDPMWFVDQCEDAVRGSARTLEPILGELQRIEWQLLFDYCYRRAADTGR